jgi:hypothetical protein
MDLAIDLTNRDLILKNGDFYFKTGVEACQQRLQIKLLFFFQEWFLDTTIGLDWFGTVYVKNPNQNLIDNMILVTMTDDIEVIEVTEYSTSFSLLARKLTIKMKLNTIFGIVNLNEVIPI